MTSVKKPPVSSESLTLADLIFPGKGEMAGLMRVTDWSRTPIGRVASWPPSLRTAVSICLGSRHPIVIWWGPERWMFYNDAYRPMLGDSKHPQFLGASGQACWSEIWEVVGPMMDQVIETGEATWSENQLLPLNRYGYVEETYFTLSYSPILDDEGRPNGIFCACTETSRQVLGERRMKTVRELNVDGLDSGAAAQLCADVLGHNPHDVPFSLIYLLDADGEHLRLAGRAGLEADSVVSPALVLLKEAVVKGSPLARVARGGGQELVQDLSACFVHVPCAPWNEPARRALLTPLGDVGSGKSAGVLVLGISPKRAFDNDYRDFFELISSCTSAVLSKARARQAGREQAERLERLDRAAPAGSCFDLHKDSAQARILIADDNADMREYLVRLLEPHWRVDAFVDGLAALEAALADPPDLILSDIMMPRMDGVTLLRALRTNPTTSTTPVLLLSARTGEEAVVAGLETGADDFLAKPFSANELVARVRTHINLARLRREWAQQLGKLNEELRTSLLQAQAAHEETLSGSRAQTEFLAVMSHEIRTPLNAVIGFAGLLSESYLPQRQREFINAILASGEHLRGVVDDVLDFSKLQSGRFELSISRFGLRPTIESALNVVAGKAAEKGLDIAYIIGRGVPAGLEGDEARIRQILINYLSNAVKFTAVGEVVLEVQVGPTGADGRQEFHFSVRDTGRGISAERMDRLFRVFSQTDASIAGQFGGTGLGLAICKELAELHGGRVWAQSEAGVGSSFHLAFPATGRPDVEGDTLRKHGHLRGLRALIVDDNKTNIAILRAQTESWEMSVRSTESPQEALSWLVRGEAFDLIFTDHHMPVMDGIELAVRIRSLAHGSRTPIILFSSMGGSARLTPELAGLFSAVLTKPIRQSELLNRVGEILRPPNPVTRAPSTRQPEPPPPLKMAMSRREPLGGSGSSVGRGHIVQTDRPPAGAQSATSPIEAWRPMQELPRLKPPPSHVGGTEASAAEGDVGGPLGAPGSGCEWIAQCRRRTPIAPHSLTILLAEDNLMNQKLALALLESIGHRADVVANGLDAIDALDRKSYDVILMDMQMARLNGIQATLAIRARGSSIRQPYIIAMTANVMRGDRAACLAAGMNDYVSKPIDPQELADALQKASSQPSPIGRIA